MLKTNKNGKKYYYYYKKKVGRHKKTGKKRVPKKRGRTWQELWDFKIIKCTFNKQDEFIGIYHDLSEVEQVRRQLEFENSKVILPIKYVNSSNITNSKYNITEFISEYVILKRIRSDMDRCPVRIRDEYGRLIVHTTNSDVWNIYDKLPCLKEEHFWVYGYNPQSDRKNCKWILDNLLTLEIESEPSIVVQIYLFKNKLVLTYDNILKHFVICKNISDAIRLYNKLNELTIKKKGQRIYFMGQASSYTQKGKEIIKQLIELTGWRENKIRQKTT